MIAGKGHETYQILGPTTIHFDDREVAAEELAALGFRPDGVSDRATGPASGAGGGS